MAAGFIHDKLEIKFLILYIAARVSEPLPPEGMQELTMCDDGNDLVQTEHLRLTEEGCYAITPKGLKNSEICESSLPYSVRLRTDRNVAEYNRRLLRKNQVQSRVIPRENGSYVVELRLRDDVDSLMTLDPMWTASCAWSLPPPPRPWPGTWRTGSGRTRRASIPACCRPCTPLRKNKSKRGERRSPRFVIL